MLLGNSQRQMRKVRTRRGRRNTERRGEKKKKNLRSSNRRRMRRPGKRGRGWLYMGSNNDLTN
jgi:hypothetical protein